jgi:uncharacterized protein (DUF952 family)
VLAREFFKLKEKAMHPAIIFHFAKPDDWLAAKSSGKYAPSNWQAEGFIHCATEQQIAGVIERHLKGRGRFIKLALNAELLKQNLRYDWSDVSRDHYPHVYAEIALSSVLAVEEVVL